MHKKMTLHKFEVQFRTYFPSS